MLGITISAIGVALLAAGILGYYAYRRTEALVRAVGERERGRTREKGIGGRRYVDPRPGR
jgi:hypothetical protein